MSDDTNEDMRAHDRTPVTVERWILQCVFDTAINGMDFGSGMLSQEETNGLRALAVVLGVDPMTATPTNMKCQYDPDGHAWTYYPHMQFANRCGPLWRCSTCGKQEYSPPPGWKGGGGR